MKPLESYWRREAKRALKRLRLRKPKPKVVRTQQPRCSWPNCFHAAAPGLTTCHSHSWAGRRKREMVP